MCRVTSFILYFRPTYDDLQQFGHFYVWQNKVTRGIKIKLSLRSFVVTSRFYLVFKTYKYQITHLVILTPVLVLG